MNMAVGFRQQVNHSTAQKNYGVGNTQRQQAGFGANLIIEPQTTKVIERSLLEKLTVFMSEFLGGYENVPKSASEILQKLQETFPELCNQKQTTATDLARYDWVTLLERRREIHDINKENVNLLRFLTEKPVSKVMEELQSRFAQATPEDKRDVTLSLTKRFKDDSYDFLGINHTIPNELNLFSDDYDRGVILDPCNVLNLRNAELGTCTIEPNVDAVVSLYERTKPKI